MSAVGRLRPVVLLRLQPGCPAAAVRQVEQAVAALPRQIAEVQSLA